MKPKAAKFSPSFHLQVGECQKEGSGSGKQGSRGRGDLWVLSQGGQRKMGGREGGREAEEREQECREGRGMRNNKIYETKREETFRVPNQNPVSCIFNPLAKHWCMCCAAYLSGKEPTENVWKWEAPPPRLVERHAYHIRVHLSDFRTATGLFILGKI